MSALAVWTAADGLLSAVAPTRPGGCGRYRCWWSIWIRMVPPIRGRASLADLVADGPRRTDLVPGRDGVAVLRNGGVACAEAREVVEALIDGWPHLVVRVADPEHAAGWPRWFRSGRCYPACWPSGESSSVYQTDRVLVNRPARARCCRGSGRLSWRSARRDVVARSRWVAAWRQVWRCRGVDRPVVDTIGRIRCAAPARGVTAAARALLRKKRPWPTRSCDRGNRRPGRSGSDRSVASGSGGLRRAGQRCRTRYGSKARAPGAISPPVMRMPTAVVAAVERVIAPLGLRLDRASPSVDARLADGSRLHAVVPPVSVDGPSLPYVVSLPPCPTSSRWSPLVLCRRRAPTCWRQAVRRAQQYPGGGWNRGREDHTPQCAVRRDPIRRTGRDD